MFLVCSLGGASEIDSHLNSHLLPSPHSNACVQVPLAVGDAENATAAPSSASRAVMTLPDADIRLQNWTVVADGEAHALFPAGTVDGQGGLYAASAGGCSDALDYRPLATPLPGLAPGNYSVCQRSATAGAQYIGFVWAIGPTAFRTEPADVTALSAFRIAFVGVRLGPGDSWAPSATGDCNGTWAPVAAGNGTGDAGVVEGWHRGLPAGAYTVCYSIGGTTVALRDAVVVRALPGAATLSPGTPCGTSVEPSAPREGGWGAAGPGPCVRTPPPAPPPSPGEGRTRHGAVKQGKSGGAVGTTSQENGGVRRGVGIGQGGRGRAQGGERRMGAAAYGGKGFKGRASGKWREANRRRPLQTTTQPGVIPPPPPKGF